MDALIQVDQLVKVYHIGSTAVHALRGVTTVIQRGEFVAIMGPSGSGKSTFMNILGCLDRPTSGSYILDGVSVNEMHRDQLAEIRNSKIGFVFQNYNLLPRVDAMENVELPLLYSGKPEPDGEERARRALGAVGMAGWEHHHSNQLSGGQQQRVAIARALITNPRVLMADEPTGALDSRTSVEIMAIIQELNRTAGLSVILVTHEPDIAGFAGRIIQFRDGRIVRDQSNPQPRDARVELDRLPPVEEEAEEVQQPW